MKFVWKSGLFGLLLLGNVLLTGVTVQAAEEPTMKTGVYIDDMDMSGLTRAQVLERLEDYVAQLEQVELTLIAANGNKVQTTGEALGMQWANEELVQEAMELGTKGNVIERYKAIKDLENDKRNFSMVFDYDMQAINDILAQEAMQYNQAAVDFSLIKEGKEFKVVEGQIGYALDMETSIDIVYDFLTTQWEYAPCEIQLDIKVEQPRGSVEELAAVQDIMGSYTTSFTSSGAERTANVTNGCRLINGVLLYPGDEFSALELVTPFTQANGYAMAGSYLNGKVVDSLGGGICQVTTTLYNAVLLSELEITERYNHSMSVSYVPPANDAAIAESAGKDFKFVNNTEAPIYIEGFVQKKHITFNIYGKEYRPENRVVTYESEVLEVINPTTDNIIADASKHLGYLSVEESAHIGYKSKLWKVVTVDGVETERTQVNSSKYKMTPRTAVVGTATADPNAYNEIMAAIGTGSIDHVRNVIALLQGAAQQVVIADI